MKKENQLDTNRLTIPANSSLKSVIEQMNDNGLGFVCVVNEQSIVTGTVTDGDVRRAVLKGFDLATAASTIMNVNPITILEGLAKKEIMLIFKSKKIRNLPVLDEEGALIDLINLSQFLEEPNEDVEKVAVIMAGGEGKRLRPYTESTPKPMLELDGKPILENIILKLKEHGFNKFHIAVNYLADVIINYLGDGSSLGVSISYLRETKKLGTAGALSMLKGENTDHILILNGDVVSDINFQQLFNSHLDKTADFTMAASIFKFDIPFGVLKLEGEKILGVTEKPTKEYLCNAGIYMLSSKVIDLVPADTFFDMTELLNKAISKDLKTNVFPMHECWLDIGRKEDFLKAQQDGQE